MSKRHRTEAKPPVSVAPSWRLPQPVAVSRVLLVLRGCGALLLAGLAASVLVPEWRLWGFHLLNFLPLPLSALLALAALLLWTPWGGKITGRIFVAGQKFRGRSALFWAAVAAVVCMVLAVRVPLLGDGVLWVNELSWIGEFQARGQAIPPSRWKMRKEPLEIALHEGVFRIVTKFRSPDPMPRSASEQTAILKARGDWFQSAARRTYAWLSILAGAVALYAMIQFARCNVAPNARAPFLLTVFGGAGILLFFGYIEHYSWTSVSILLFGLAGLSDARAGRPFPWRTTFAFMAALLCHLASVFLLPALALLIANRGGRSRFDARRLTWIILAGFVLLGGFGYFWVKGWKGWLSIIPLFSRYTPDGYALFSFRHLLDLFNQLVLAAAPAVLLLVPAPAEQNVERTQRLFLTLAAGCGAAFVFAFNPNLGMPRDWDLLTVALWPLLLAAAWRVAVWDFGAERSRVVASLLALWMLIPLPYILVNALETSSVHRFEAVLRLDPARAAYGWENLAKHYEQHDLAGRIRAWQAAATVSRNPRYKVNLATSLRIAGRLSEAEPLCIQAAREKRDYSYHINYLALAHIDRGNFDKARELLAISGAINPADTTWLSILADLDKRPARAVLSTPQNLR